jgi:GH24 family phage-related lysozyme (muramidase)
MTPTGLLVLKTCEACRLRGYADPITHGAPFACGYGCTGEGITLATVWTQARAESELLKRVQQTEVDLAHALPWFSHLLTAEPVRADVLVNIAFNIGVHGLAAGWPVTMAAVGRGDWLEAANDIEGNSKWVGQVHEGRARACAHAMATGSWAGGQSYGPVPCVP